MPCAKTYQDLARHGKKKDGVKTLPPKIDKNYFRAYVPAVAYPKQKPEKVSVSAGISLPADLKEAAARKAALEDKSLSAVVRTFLRGWLEQTGESLAASGQKNLKKAQSATKKPRRK